MKGADAGEALEAAVLLNVGFNLENALNNACQKVAEAPSSTHTQAATEAFSFLHHYLQASYERVQERAHSLSDSGISEHSEAVILQKYLHEQEQPYILKHYQGTKEKFAELFSGLWKTLKTGSS